jgi:hypothetical protein
MYDISDICNGLEKDCGAGFLSLNTAAVIYSSHASVSGWLDIYSLYLDTR